MPSQPGNYNYTVPQLESRMTSVNDKTGEYQYFRDSFVRASQDSYNSPPSQHPDKFESLLNVQPPTQGNLQRRWGYNAFSFHGAQVARQLVEYQNDSAGARKIIFASTEGVLATGEDGVNYNTAILTPGGGAVTPRIVVSRDYAYITDGVAADRIKWDGSAVGGTSAWGADSPTTVVSISGTVAGAVTLTQGRYYFAAFRNSSSGFTTGLSPVSASSGPVTAKNINLSHAEMPSDAQLDRRIWLATADAGDQTVLYLLGDTPIATTTLTDNVPDNTLLLNDIFQENDDAGVPHGIADNDRPPTDGRLPIKHKGRIVMVSGQYLYFSKSADEVLTSTGLITSRYEECWPATYQLDVSEGAETIAALMTDGDTLYVGTERHIRRITGQSPFDFTKPEIVFNNVGVLNQDVWKMVFTQGAPLGTMWLTPDFRLMMSDFNSYDNIGTPVQDILNSINPAAASKCHAMFGSDGPHDLYILAVPTGSNTECDTLIVYHVGTKSFTVWQPTSPSTAMLVNINASGITQWLFASSNHFTYKFSKTALSDDGTGYTHTARTTWLSMGDPTTRKLLNEIQLMGDPTMRITIHGATTTADFQNPYVVVAGAALATSPFGSLRVALAQYISRYRYYRLTFTSTSDTVQSFLDNFALTAFPSNRL